MVNINELTNPGALDGTEEVEILKGGVNRKSTTQTIANKATIPTSQVTDYTTATDTRIDNKINVPGDTEKTTPVDTDVFALWDSMRKQVTWANIKATLQTSFNTLYHPLNGLRTGLTANKMLITNGSGVEGYADAAVMASDAEAAAGTNETKYVNPKQVFRTVDFITGTRTGSSTGAQVINHTLGRTPKFIFAIARVVGKPISSVGMWCSDGQSSFSDFSSSISVDPGFSTANLIDTSNISAGGSDRSLNGSVTASSSASITITWAISGSGGSQLDVTYSLFIYG